MFLLLSSPVKSPFFGKIPARKYIVLDIIDPGTYTVYVPGSITCLPMCFIVLSLVCIVVERPSQQLFSHIGTEPPLPWY